MSILGIDEAIRHYTLSLIRDYRINPYERVYCHPKTGYDLGLPSEEYVLIRGPEILLTCIYHGYIGQAFTVLPREYRGRIIDVLNMDLKEISNRGVFYAFLNALFRSLGLVDKTMHCRSYEPVKCGVKLASYILAKYGVGKRVLHIGYQPGHVEYLAYFLRDNLLVTDLRNDTVWRSRYGRLVYDGLFNENYIGASDIILVTASSIVNKSFWNIISRAYIMDKKIYLYGVSASAIAYFINKHTLFKINVFCPYAK
ncbi:conserved hypothetical protein [Staphylothermus marinus F1]|uniref:Putative heavy-metal chelation domain-containing protein n=1 Tax=Staphylothermus marinus (strain ATCC 43588 / DSM 3639 / JCM 9404 / F1) TaxID=399550 RepID=A3DPW7_STAMF|nr:DUF364 domain-containing protein [Staphylothermus marinus]ABN70677.1 conserved hypothetical protein [Staphylothermus marinus F1]